MIHNTILGEIAIRVFFRIYRRYICVEAVDVVDFCATYTSHQAEEVSSHPHVELHLIINMKFLKQSHKVNFAFTAFGFFLFFDLEHFGEEFWQRSFLLGL